MEEFWNDRYRKKSYAYGKRPNAFFKKQLDNLAAGKILLPADGEGRNSVYAATQSWDVYANDLSIEGKLKASKLAKASQTTIHFEVGDFGELTYPKGMFDTIALIYAHFPAELKSTYHKKAASYLKIGGHLIFEAFSKNHLNYNTINPKVGGPKNAPMLFSIAELKTDFMNYEFKIMKESVIDLHEGDYHIGKGAVIRCVGKKIS